jgi:hypothetical protein
LLSHSKSVRAATAPVFAESLNSSSVPDIGIRTSDL